MPTTTPPPTDDLARLLKETAGDPWPTIDDRDAWERAGADGGYGAAVRAAALDAARGFAGEPAVSPTLTDFLAFSRTGDRAPWEARLSRLGARRTAFVLAACFTGEPEWVDRAADELNTLCELTTWVYSAHEYAALPDPDDPYIDLHAAMAAQAVAEILQVLGPAFDRIHGRIARRARRELDRRVFDPFLARGDFWWLWPQPGRPTLNNWTAVCSGGVLVAALGALDHDPERQARVVRKAVWSLGFFRDTFGASGSLDEGAGYWAYGMSYYVMAAERLLARTGGQIDLLPADAWTDVARFPTRVRLYGDTFADFSDCAPRVRPAHGWVGWLGRHLDLPELTAWAERLAEPAPGGVRPRYESLPDVLRGLFWGAALTPVPSPPGDSRRKGRGAGGEGSHRGRNGRGRRPLHLPDRCPVAHRALGRHGRRADPGGQGRAQRRKP